MKCIRFWDALLTKCVSHTDWHFPKIVESCANMCRATRKLELGNVHDSNTFFIGAYSRKQKWTHLKYLTEGIIRGSFSFFFSFLEWREIQYSHLPSEPGKIKKIKKGKMKTYQVIPSVGWWSFILTFQRGRKIATPPLQLGNSSPSFGTLNSRPGCL